MTAPRGLVKCPVCGEYRGQVKAGDLNWMIPRLEEDPNRIIKVTCLCDGIPCPKCKKNNIHRPISNSYDEKLNTIEHWPYLTGYAHCEECNKKELRIKARDERARKKEEREIEELKKKERLKQSESYLMKEFIRVIKDNTLIKVEVCEISWDKPYDPTSNWVVGAELSADSSQLEIDRAVKKILHNKQYFRVCDKCGERNPDGWMDDDSTCQACAGAVY